MLSCSECHRRFGTADCRVRGSQFAATLSGHRLAAAARRVATHRHADDTSWSLRWLVAEFGLALVILNNVFELPQPETSMSGHTLNITKINRDHMGAYQCVANNGIPPAASFTFNLEVHCACGIKTPPIENLMVTLNQSQS